MQKIYLEIRKKSQIRKKNWTLFQSSLNIISKSMYYDQLKMFFKKSKSIEEFNLILRKYKLAQLI